MKKMLGTFDKIWQLWAKYPNGAVEGDAAIVGGVQVIWDNVRKNWKMLIDINKDHKNHEIDGDVTILDNLIVAGNIRAYGLDPSNKGLFLKEEDLLKKWPNNCGKAGDWALVLSEGPKTFAVWRWECGGWKPTGKTTDVEIDTEAFIGREEYERMLAEGYVYGGHVGTDTVVEEPKRNTFYVVTEKGTYDNLGGVVIENNGAYAVRCTLHNGEKTYNVDRIVMFDDVNSNYETRTMSQKAIHELVSKRTDQYQFRGIVEVDDLSVIKESYEGEGGSVVYNKTTNKFIVRVQSEGLTAYYETSSKFPLAGASPMIGRFYQTDAFGKNLLYLGYKNGLMLLSEPLGEEGESGELPMTQKAVSESLKGERFTREYQDDLLLGLINAIKESNNIADVVKTYADLEKYDKKNLNDNDIIIVLNEDGYTRFYKYQSFPELWLNVASVENPYTKSAADETFVKKANLAKETGVAEDTAMTQKATTNAISSASFDDKQFFLRSISGINLTSYSGGAKLQLNSAINLLRNMQNMYSFSVEEGFALSFTNASNVMERYILVADNINNPLSWKKDEYTFVELI